MLITFVLSNLGRQSFDFSWEKSLHNHPKAKILVFSPRGEIEIKKKKKMQTLHIELIT